MQRLLKYQGLLVVGLLVLGRAGVGRAQQPCRGDVNDDGHVTAADAEALPPLLFPGADLDDATKARADANGDGVVSGADFTAILLADGLVCTTPTATGTRTRTPTRTATSTVTPTASRSPTVTPTDTPAGSPTRTPTRTASGTPVTGTPTLTRTPTVTPTVTQTRTQPPTPTPTTACLVEVAQLGTIMRELTASDCQRTFQGKVRYTDAYSIVGTPGQAMKIEVFAGAPPAGPTPTSTPSLVPFVMVLDADGQFSAVAGLPPIEFVVPAADQAQDGTTSQPYQFFVTTDPSTAQQLGSYTLRISSRPCPTPVALPLPRSLTGNLTSAQCPDPAVPTTGGVPNPVDVYTFTLPQAQVPNQANQVPTNISITMRQSVATDNINPALVVIGPDGFEILNVDEDNAGGIGDADEQVRFLALQAGTYTIIASGGIGRYSLSLASPRCKPTALTNIPDDAPLACPGQSGPGCSGTLSGDTTKTTCAAPLPVLGVDEDVPELNSPADLYSFTANAGDVISLEMDSDSDAHLFLIGPDSAGNPLVAEDDDSSVVGASNAQLAATLPLPGTYTIVAANNTMLQPPDPVEEDPGETSDYTLFVQKCPARGDLNISAGTPVTSTFDVFDCFGFGSIPFRSYTFSGTAGQFVSATMKSGAVDAFLRIFAPDGTQVANDDDQFNAQTSDARANRILPVSGTYFVEVSASLDTGEVDVNTVPPPAYTLQAKSCTPTDTPPGAIDGIFQDSDCELDGGRKFDVYTYFPGAAPTPRAASILPPSNGCVVALLPDGPQVPADHCEPGVTEIPVVGAGPYAFMIVANAAGLRGMYHAQFSSCPVSVVGYGDTPTGSLTAADCAAATGAPADWFLFRAPATLVHFNDDVVFGSVTPSFALGGLLSDAFGGVSLPASGSFSDDSDSLLPLGGDLAALVRVSGATPSDHGSYTLSTDPAAFRQ